VDRPRKALIHSVAAREFAGMTSRRVQKAAQAVREVVSMAILTELNDPRISDVTVTYVEVMPDMRQARVHVSIMGSDTKQRLCLEGLQRAAGFLQSKVANRIETRYTPRLQFVLDEGVKKSIKMAEILGRVLPPKPAADADEELDDEAAADEPDDDFDEDALEDEDESEK
jgi:ribosome-binding factor A